MLKHGRGFLFSESGKHILNKFVCGLIQKHLVSPYTVAAMSTEIEKKFALPQKFRGSEKNVWVEYIQLASDYNPVNLGQGFPDFSPPEHITKALAAIVTGPETILNQYTRGFGHPRLVNAIARLYSKLMGRVLNPLNEVMITSGAYEALFSVINGHISPGDEAIVIEPFFDCYDPMIRMAGGKPVFIALKPTKFSGVVTSSDWVLDRDELASLFNEKTKLIIVNTPHNPIGKVFTVEELEFIADLCKKWNVMCIADEVYEWIVYKPNTHVRMSSLPGMWERTITVGSAGKTFSVTGWKIGWAYGPHNLIYNAQVVHQNCVYTCSTPIQEALAVGFEYEMDRLGSDDCYFNSLAEELVAKKKFIVDFLREFGMVPTEPEGGYFVVADWTPLESKINLSKEVDKYKDYKFTKWMTKNVGLQGIPPSAFYSDSHKHLGENYVRYCFIKRDENLHKAAELLRAWKARM